MHRTFLTVFVSFLIVVLLAPAQAATTLTRNLSLGSSGEDVRILQHTLKTKGYIVAETGAFDKATETALKRFQCAKMFVCQGSPTINGYGQAGPRTRTALTFIIAGTPISTKGTYIAKTTTHQAPTQTQIPAPVIPPVQILIPDTTVPSQPGVIVASSITQTTVILSWTASTDLGGIAGYKVYRDGTLIASPTSNSYAVTGLTSGTTYTFTLQAYDLAQNISSPSLPTSITTAVNPVVTYSLSVDKTGSGIVSGAGINCGTVCSQSSLTAGSFVTLTATPAAGFSFSGWSGGTCNGTEVCTFAMNGSKTVSAAFTQNAPALSISVLTSTVTAVSSIISWATNRAADSQVLYGPTAAYGNQTPIDTTMTTDHEVLLTGLLSSNIYHYQVRSKDALGAVVVSGDQIFTTMAPPTPPADTTPPSQPGVITTSSLTQTGVVLSWTASTDNVGVSGYKVFKNGTQISSPTANTYSVTGLSPGTTYTFTVSAYDATMNNSILSLPVSVTTSVNPVVTYSLVATKVGLGTVTGNGLNCGSVCSISLTSGTHITLTATPQTGYVFSGWAGVCTGGSTCDAVISANSTVTATFTLSTPTPPGGGSGTIIDNFDSGISAWSFYAGGEFPGASGSFTGGQGHTGSGGHLSFSMSGQAHYVLAQRPVTTSVQAATVSFWLKAPAALEVHLRVVDSTGQTLQYSRPRNLEAVANQFGWTYQTIKLTSPSSYFSGASDGVLHQPITSISLGAEPIRYYVQGTTYFTIPSGSIDFDDITLNAPEVVVDPSTSATYPVPGSDLPSTFGINIHGPDFTDSAYDKLQQLGMRQARTDLIWNNIETAEGVYDFTTYDSLLSNLNNRGIRALFILDYGNSLYGMNGNTAPTTPEQIAAFGNFAKAAAEHFAGRDVIYEIWNEPNIDGFWAPVSNPTQYAALAKVASQKVHEGNPNAKVTTGGVAGWDIQWMALMLSAGSASDVDAVGWHPYDSTRPENMINTLLIMKSLVAERSGRSLPMWNTEWGYSSAWYGMGGGDVGERVQAKLVVRQVITSFVAGFPFNTYYNLTNDSSNTGESEANFGLYHVAGDQKPAGLAFQILKNNTAGWQVAGLIPAELSNMHILKLQNGGSVRLIVWLDTNPPNPGGGTPVPLKLSQQPSSVTSMLGSQLNYMQTGSTYMVDVTDEPMYINF